MKSGDAEKCIIIITQYLPKDELKHEYNLQESRNANRQMCY